MTRHPFTLSPGQLVTLSLTLLALTAAAVAADPTSRPKKPTLAVLPFTTATTDPKEKDLAERLRFAVSQKLSTDTNARESGGAYDRMDNVQIDNIISALQISFAPPPAGPPSDDDLQKLLTTLDTQWTIAGALKGRTLTLTLYQGTTSIKSASIDIPPDRESPKLAVEKILTDLTGTAFAHIRDVEADHSDPKVEARFAARPNLIPDPTFSLAATDPRHIALNWHTILGAADYPPPLLTAAQAAALPQDRTAIIPITAVRSSRLSVSSSQPTASPDPSGFCLMMRLSKNIAENNGLACESTWIPIEANKKYRFTALYHSTGPVSHIFLKGFAQNPDKYGDKSDPEASRREYYRAQVLPRKANQAWDLVEMDFTPSTVKPTDPKIQWLRVDLYIYLTPGDIFFTNITVKKLDE